MKFQLLFLLLIGAFSGLCQPAPPGAPAVVITEIMYHSPQIGNDDLEFIEVRNPSDTAERSLAFHSFTQGIEFTFPAGLIVQPKEYVLVAKDSIAFENAFGIPAFQWTSGDLDNTGETIMLMGTFNNLVDSVTYSSSAPWPLEAAGNGKSIVLCNDTLANGGPSNWTAAANNTGIVVNGTTLYANPGAECSVTDGVKNVALTELKIFPNPNNGMFSITIPPRVYSEYYDLNMFDSKGKSVFSESGNFDSNSTISISNSLPAGIYFLSLQTKGERISERLLILE